MSVSWQRVIFCLLLALESFQWVVHWDYIVSSAPFLTDLRLWELNLEIWAERSRSRAWQYLNLRNVPQWLTPLDLEMLSHPKCLYLIWAVKIKYLMIMIFITRLYKLLKRTVLYFVYIIITHMLPKKGRSITSTRKYCTWPREIKKNYLLLQ